MKKDKRNAVSLSAGMQFGSVKLPDADDFLPQPEEDPMAVLGARLIAESQSRERVDAAVIRVRGMMINPLQRDLMHRDELSDKRSLRYAKEFDVCTEDEQDRVLATLEREKIIRVLDMGQIRNLRAKGTVIRVPHSREADATQPRAHVKGKGARGQKLMLYLISNPAMPGWLKNGHTARDPEDRADDMKTDAPMDYLVETAIALPAGWVDSNFHSYLAKVAGAKNREWFFMPLDLARQVIQLVIDGNEHLVDQLPKAEPPSVLSTIRNTFRDRHRNAVIR